MSRRQRRSQIGGQFAPRLIEMLNSPAYRVLSLSAHRLLARIEIELASHGGTENGNLPVTFDNFVTYGIHRHAVAPAIREVVMLGFVETTEHGRAGNAEFRSPNQFRLTYRHTKHAEPTDEWRRVKTLEDANAMATKARQPPTPKTNSQCRKKPVSVPETGTENALVPVPETITTVLVRKPSLLSISRGGETQQDASLYLLLLSSSQRACTLLIGAAYSLGSPNSYLGSPEKPCGGLEGL